MVHDAKEIGFADEFIYAYIQNRLIENAPIHLEKLLRDEALQTFKVWEIKLHIRKVNERRVKV